MAFTMRALLPLHILGSILLLCQLCSARDCYWPNGNVAEQYVACNTTTTETMCCRGSGYSACLTNGLCLWLSDLSMDRGACTDKSWNSQSCANICRNAPVNEHADVTQCLGTSQPTYCCGQNNDCCNGTTGITANNVWDGSNYRVFMPMGDVSSTTLTLSSASSTATAQTTNSAAAAAAAAPECHEVAIGAGVGASLGAALLLLCGVLFWEVSKRKKLQKQHQNQPAYPVEHAPVYQPYYQHQPPQHAELGPRPVNELDASK